MGIYVCCVSLSSSASQGWMMLCRVRSYERGGELIFPHHSRLDPTTTAAACPDDQTRKNSKVSCNTERILMHKKIDCASFTITLKWLGTEMPRKGTAQFLNSFASWNRPSLFLAHLPSKSRLGDSNIAMARRDTIVQLSETYIPHSTLPLPRPSSSF